ncbi:threonine synthase [Vulcanisaeta thermophila]|uniref:threonine synthase n=1 Tax=Vulcanisaeta thermophila TaxID=867917 RepID=UPI000853BA1B|nr:pyridoxal-phosphate dependent enzyme [Vulcanisaeta thermophila]
MDAHYKCARCGFTAPIDRWFWRCPRCGGTLYIELERPRLVLTSNPGIWRYSSIIPARPLVTLGEGNTPLVEAKFLGPAVYLKLEYLNPTGSFKDRGSAVAVSKAAELGGRVVVEDSSGNAGISISAYAGSVGIRARIYVPADAPRGKKELIKALGAEVVEAPTREDAGKMAVSSLGVGEFYIGHSWNPWFLEGTKTLAYELMGQLGHGPSAIILPVSAGTLLLGLYKGFSELIGMGIVDRLPRLFAVQAMGYADIYRALHGEAPGEPSKLADALRVKNPPRLEEAANAVRMSGGDAVVVNDHEITKAWQYLIRRGFIVEPSSATALAGYWRLRESGALSERDEVVIVLTGSGLKYVDLMGIASGGS